MLTPRKAHVRALREASAANRYHPPKAPRFAYDHLLGQDDHSRELDQAGLERCARRLVEGIEVWSDTLLGHSSLRVVCCGQRLDLLAAPALGLPVPDAGLPLVLDAIEHAGFNNLPKAERQAIDARLGEAQTHLYFETPPGAPQHQPDTLGLVDLGGVDALREKARAKGGEDGAWDESEDWDEDDAEDARVQSAPLTPPPIPADPALIARARQHGYANCFRAIRHERPWRPPLTPPDSVAGPYLSPRPVVSGAHTALVVGPDGEATANGQDEIYTNARGDIRVRFHWQGEAALGQFPEDTRADNRGSRWVRVAQRQAGPGLGWQWLPRIGQEVLVKFTDGDPDQPFVIGALYNGRGEGGSAPTPGGAPAKTRPEDAAQTFAAAHDGAPSAQHNLAAGLGGGHAPAWHGASPDRAGHRNAAALSGFKSKELGGQGYNQLLFDDSNRQLRIQLASSSQSSQLNLGHLIAQQDNYRGGVRGQGFELRSDGHAVLRGGAGVLLSTYHGPTGKTLEPTGDFAAGMALARQLMTLGQSLDTAAQTHKTARLPGQAGSDQAGQSAIDETRAPHAALLRSLSTLVDADSPARALSEAGDKNPTTGPGRVPHTGDAVIAAAAKDGILAIAGQHQQWLAGEDLTLAAGGPIDLAVNAQARLHAGQAIGLLAAAAGADDAGLRMIAAQDDLTVEAQSDTLKVRAKEGLSLDSATRIDLAAARRIRIATEQGAALTIEGGNITFEAPGKITYRAGMRKFEGATKMDHALPEFAPGDGVMRRYILHRAGDGGVIGEQKYRLVLSDGRVIEGTSTARGETGLAESESFLITTIELLND